MTLNAFVFVSCCSKGTCSVFGEANKWEAS